MDSLALILLAAGGAGAVGGAWLAWGATYQRAAGWRWAWVTTGAFIGMLVVAGLPASCVDQTTGNSEATERPSGRYP